MDQNYTPRYEIKDPRNIQDCHVSSKGAVKLAAALCKNTTLEHLDLSHKPIGEHVEGVTAVAKVLVENKTLCTSPRTSCIVVSDCEL